MIKDIFKNLFWIWITVLIVVLDRITKLLVIHHLQFEHPVAVMPFFNLNFTYNAGAAFSFLNRPGIWPVLIFGALAVVVSIFLVFWLLRLNRSHIWLKVALALVLGGTLGNLFDRIAYHYVVDFLDFYFSRSHFAAFNVADSAITIGAIMLVVDLVCRETSCKKH